MFYLVPFCVLLTLFWPEKTGSKLRKVPIRETLFSLWKSSQARQSLESWDKSCNNSFVKHLWEDHWPVTRQKESDTSLVCFLDIIIIKLGVLLNRTYKDR